MDALVTALGPVLAAGLALQQLLELLDPWIERIITKGDEKRKKLLLSIVSLVVGLAFSFVTGLRVLGALGLQTAALIDLSVTGLIISGGTQGINSIVKFLGYSKEKEKAEAAAARQAAGRQALDKIP